MSHAYNKIRRGILALTALLTLGVTQSSAQWSELPGLAQVRNLPMTAVAGGKLYVWGGSSVDMGLTDFIPNGASLSTGMMYSLANGTGGSWTATLPMPEPRNGGYATSINGKIYIFGGNNIVSNQLNFLTAVQEYDPSTQSYTAKRQMPTAVFGPAYATIGTKVFVMGGMSLSGQNVQFNNLIQVYDASTDQWQTLTSTTPYVVGYGTATAIGQKILLVGGATVQSGQLVYSNNAYMATPGPTGELTWAQVKEYPVPVSLAASGTLNGKAYVAGGENGSGILNLVYRYDEAGNKWDPFYTLPAPVANVHSMPSDGTSLYLVGGRESKRVFKMTEGTPVPVAAIAQTEFFVTAAPNSAAQNIAIRLGNNGVVALNGSINIPAEAQSWISTQNGTFSDIMPGTASNLTVAVGGPSVGAGDYKATVMVKTNDPSHADIPVTIRLYVRDGVPSQETRVVMEESSGNWCPPCGAYGIPLIRDLQAQYGEDLILIAYHDRGGRPSEPMHTAETEEIGGKLGVPFWPAAAFQRFVFPGEKAPMIGTGSWETAVATVLAVQPKAPVALELKEYNYNLLDNKITAKLHFTTTQAIPWNQNLSLRVTAVATEDSIQYEQAGNDEDPFYHMHVARDFWPNTSGQSITVPTTALDGEGVAILPGQSFDVDVTFSPENLSAPRRSHVVFLVHVNQGSTLGPILQGLEFPMTGSVGGSGGFTFDAGITSKAVAPNEKGVFEATVHNNGTSPVELTGTRVNTEFPEDNWSSWICVGDDCATPAENSKSTVVLPNQSKTFKVHIQSGSSGQGKVTLRVSDGQGNNYEQLYTLNASGSGVAVEPVAGNGLRLMANVPNPASTTTRFGYVIPKAANVTVELFAVNGAKVLTVAKGNLEAGEHTLDLDVSSLPNGIYTVRLTANGTSVARTISVTR